MLYWRISSLKLANFDLWKYFGRKLGISYEDTEYAILENLKIKDTKYQILLNSKIRILRYSIFKIHVSCPALPNTVHRTNNMNTEDHFWYLCFRQLLERRYSKRFNNRKNTNRTKVPVLQTYFWIKRSCETEQKTCLAIRERFVHWQHEAEGQLSRHCCSGWSSSIERLCPQRISTLGPL